MTFDKEAARAWCKAASDGRFGAGHLRSALAHIDAQDEKLGSALRANAAYRARIAELERETLRLGEFQAANVALHAKIAELEAALVRQVDERVGLIRRIEELEAEKREAS